NKSVFKDISVIDAHCDALLAVIGKSQIPGDSGCRDFLVRNKLSHIDLPKLLEGRVRCQFMALFAEDEDVPRALAYTHALIDRFDEICARSGGRFFRVLTGADLDKPQPGTSVGALLSIEGAEALDGNLDNLDGFYARGVRALGPAWNRRNPFARGVKAEGSDGLSPLGKQLVEKMESMRMIVDVSHLSDAAFWDLAAVAGRPFIASHSNARAVNNHQRNLTDEQIRVIADRGGAIGVVFVPTFVALKPVKPYLEHLIDHIDHIARIGGIDTVALGSDFDGYRGVEGQVLKDASEYGLLCEALLARGYSPAMTAKIMGGHWERVIKDILG
ncbi:MAG: dipeptidase, partial [Spirochaetaceae bacterium]|nr:dipeptidase [Spirochaetaceae bacterium]